MEVLVSLVLVTIILTTFFSFFSQTVFISDKNEDKLVAFNLASKTLNIIEEQYKKQPIPTTLYCGNFPIELVNALSPSTCFFKQNNKNYYPKITLTKDTDYLNLTIVHVQIFDSEDITNRKLLSETYGYIRQEI
nr:hypothetical protein [Bacillus marasmi]